MRNRKTIIVAFLLVAAMAIGVGYAALTDTLTVIGDAVIDIDKANETFDLKVHFTETVTKSSDGTGTVDDIASASADAATYTVNKLATVGQKSTFVFTIKNESNVDAVISVNPKKLSGADNESNSNPSYFTVTYSYPDGKNITKNGGEIKVQVDVVVAKPITVATSATFGLELTATSVDPV